MCDFLDLFIKQQGSNWFMPRCTHPHLVGVHITATLKSFNLAQTMWTVEKHGSSPGDGEAVYW